MALFNLLDFLCIESICLYSVVLIVLQCFILFLFVNDPASEQLCKGAHGKGGTGILLSGAYF